MKSFLLSLILIPSLLFANPEPKTIKWISFEKAIELSKTTPKPILIDVYTDWCTWCHKMDASTYNQEVIVDYINEHFYAVKLNAEQKEDITYKDHTFKFVPSGRRGTHEFAASLLNGKMSYPSTVFLNKNQELIQAIPGYLQTPIMEKLINYMGEEIYLNKEWEVFDKEFKSKI
ncbi:thioredoxin family protein [Wenyingzhuangia sp. IMCC45467]